MSAKDYPVELIVMAVGAFLIFASLLIYLAQKGRKDPATRLKFLGIEFESQTGAFVILALGCMLVAAPVLIRYYSTPTEKETSVPNVVGQTEEGARTALQGSSLNVAIERSQGDEPKGTVVSQDPSGGEKVPAKSTVRVVVSSGRPAPQARGVVGTWSEGETTFTFERDEKGYRVTVGAPGAPSTKSDARVAGSVVRFGYRTVDGIAVEARFVMSPDGSSMSGQWQDEYGRGAPAVLYKQSE